ncbi:hypothetical protein AAT19DRAFT_11031 [Rhodotorula toruloides]|uniref:Uncharacterized protein n=1 Tax=Rhodotorula toruloides TaxID=5286 RepID=A0A2S9ZYQ5_RHOTO|nr:hypothetical protein AAT19DRAFT_11031 [Rhodotorula toruloides]
MVWLAEDIAWTAVRSDGSSKGAHDKIAVVRQVARKGDPPNLALEWFVEPTHEDGLYSPQRTPQPASTRRLALPPSPATHNLPWLPAARPPILSASSARPATNTKTRRKAVFYRAPQPAFASSSRQHRRALRPCNWAGRNVLGRTSGT